MPSMYNAAGATIRADLNAVVEEAASADQFFIGEKVMPPLGVAAKSGTYPKVQIAAGELMSKGSTVRNPGSSYGQVSRSWTSDTYDCIDRGLEEPVDDTVAKDVGRFFNVESASARWCLRNVKLDHEVRVATEIMNATTYGAGTNSATAYTEANIATVSLIADILAAIERCRDKGINPNTVVMSSVVWNRVRRGTLVVNFVASQMGKGASVTLSSLASALADEGITQCLAGKARYNSAKKGQTASMTNVWGNTYIWVGAVNANAKTPQDGGSGFTFVWNEEGGLWVTETYRDESKRSNVIRVRQNTTEKVTDSTSGTLITTQYS